MANIGLIAGSFKPAHAGHIRLIEMAAAENDEVLLFVSTSDRKRPGEVPIMGADMADIWREHLEPILPSNVRVEYGGSPVAKVYKVLGDADGAGSQDVFAIYGDPTDLAQNFPEKSLIKYCGSLWKGGQIILKATQRAQTVNVSGTKMRQHIQSGDREAFLAGLPPGVNGNAIWSKLSRGNNTTAEALVREFVRHAIRRQ